MTDQTTTDRKPNLSIKERKRFDDLARKAKRYYDKGEMAEALRHYRDAWDLDPRNAQILVIISHLLSLLGARGAAIDVLQKALEVNGATEEILGICIKLALDLKLYEHAEKLSAIHVQLFPTNSFGHVSFANALGGQERFADSIAFLQGAIPQFTAVADLWNVLGSHVNVSIGERAAIPFYEEAARLAPGDHKCRNNLAKVYEDLGDFERMLDYSRQAIALKPDTVEPHLGLAFGLLRQGKLQEAWKEYEFRYSKHNPNTTWFIVLEGKNGLPRWTGGDIAGKTVFALGEQGIGDELLFGLSLRQLEAAGAKLVIGVDARFVPAFKRSFPEARVVSHRTITREGYYYRSFPDAEAEIAAGNLKVDAGNKMGSIAAVLWQSPADVPAGAGYLSADESSAAAWKARLDALGPGRKIGINWRSGLQTASRRKHYLDIERLKPLLDVGDAVFVNLQYGDTAEERARLEALAPGRLHHFEDLDLKNDLEGTLALMTNLDLVIGPASAPAMMAMALGVPTWWITRARPWWTFGRDDGTVPFHPAGRSFTAFAAGGFDKAILDVVAALKTDA